MTPHHDPALGVLYALSCIAASVRLRTAATPARLGAVVVHLALDRARAALADLERRR